jgi:hypothetical protein
MESTKTLFYVSNFPWARHSISSKFIENFGMRHHKDSPALT